MIGPIARIVLRYGAGALIALGLIDAELGASLAEDPDVADVMAFLFQMLADVAPGVALFLINETWYLLARRFGWQT